MREYFPSSYIGYSVGIQYPIFFNTHTSIWRRGGGRPLTVITGTPGSGKTFAGLTLTSQAAIMGYTTMVIDYKGDFLLLNQLENDFGKKVNIWDINNPAYEGSLDPFNITDDVKERETLINALISIFSGGLSKDEQNAISAVVRDAARRKNYTLVDTVNDLISTKLSNDTLTNQARSIGRRVQAVSNVERARICFARRARGGKIKKGRDMSIKSGEITVATLLGMPLPTEGEEETPEIRASKGIIYLITNYARKMLNDLDNDASAPPKLLVLDEAWAILSTQAGASTVEQIALLGRSKNLATLIITQSPDHYAGLRIENTIATRFSFKASKDEANTIINSIDLPKNEGWEEILSSMDSGMCLYSGENSNYSIMMFDAFKPSWRAAFETNPQIIQEREMRKKEREAIESNS